jgi:hypothetical protein
VTEDENTDRRQDSGIAEIRQWDINQVLVTVILPSTVKPDGAKAIL